MMSSGLAGKLGCKNILTSVSAPLVLSKYFKTIACFNALLLYVRGYPFYVFLNEKYWVNGHPVTFKRNER